MPYVQAIFPPQSGQGSPHPDLPTSLGLLSLPMLPMEGRSPRQSEGALESDPRQLRSSPQAAAMQDIRSEPTREVGRQSRVDDRGRGIYRPVGGRKAGPRVGQNWHMDRLVGPPAEGFRTLRLGGGSGVRVSLCVFQFPSYPSSFRRFLTQSLHSYRLGSWDGPGTPTAPFDVNLIILGGETRTFCSNLTPGRLRNSVYFASNLAEYPG